MLVIKTGLHLTLTGTKRSSSVTTASSPVAIITTDGVVDESGYSTPQECVVCSVAGTPLDADRYPLA